MQYDSRMGVFVYYLKFLAVGFCLALVFSVRASGANAPLEVEGVITKDTSWSGEVIVYSDVLVPEGVTLTINPGTNVVFAYSDSSKIEPMFLSMGTELLVRGRLVVAGEKGRPVTFGPAPEELDLKKPEKGDWGGLIFDGPAASSSVVSNAGIAMADSGISTFYSSPEITGCTVTDSEYGFSFMGESAPRLTGSAARGCEIGVMASHGAKLVIKDCKFEDNEQDYLPKENR